ncbi:MAG: F0F1 ATP synthase subunit A, partial [Nitrospirales bacterium]
MEDPLHPFELHALIPLSLFGLDISLNKAVVMMFVAVALVIGLLVRAGSSRQLVPTRLQSL